MGQFVNPANPDIHYRTTGAEIVEQVPNVDVFVAGIGTGGTFTGVTRRLKEHNPNHTGKEPYNYMMMSLSNAHSDGLVVLPVHREVKTIKNFSESHFMKFFKQHLHTTFTSYLNSYRLTIAARLLLTEDDSILSISERTGLSR